MDWLVIIIVVVLLLGALGPRAGWYGTAGMLWDLVSLILVIILVVWLLRLFGILVF
jgi:hypothetical protein